MSQAATARTVLACAVLAIGGCHGRAAPQPSPTTTPTTPVVVLTAERPTARIPQPGLPTATAIRLDVQDVTNPAGQGLAITLAVEDPGTPARRVDVGNVSPYPASQPGVFTLVLPGPAADLVHQGPTMLVVTLGAALPGTVLQPGVRLSLTAAATRS